MKKLSDSWRHQINANSFYFLWNRKELSSYDTGIMGGGEWGNKGKWDRATGDVIDPQTACGSALVLYITHSRRNGLLK